MQTPRLTLRSVAVALASIGGLALACELVSACGVLLSIGRRGSQPDTDVAFTAMAISIGVVLACGVSLAVGGIVVVCASRGSRRRGILPIVIGLVGCACSLAIPVFGFFVMMVIGMGMAGGAWGRPLRVRGRQLHPELRLGSDWTEGEHPDPGNLDPATRRALEALWLHDAQKEHASVPAFARISWLLAAVGAPAELSAWCHRAALEEIDHARADSRLPRDTVAVRTPSSRYQICCSAGSATSPIR